MKNYKNIFVLLLLALIFLISVNMVCASSITINNTNNTLKNVVNKYDTIYLDDGTYNGSNNKGINVSKNTTIIGLHKGLAVIDPGYGVLFTVNNGSLTLINLTIKNGHGDSLINNFESLTISNVSFENNRYGYTILTTGILKISDSSFKNGYIAVRSMYFQNVTIKNTEFVDNNIGGVWGLIHVSGFNKSLNFDNLTFINNTAYDSLISVMADFISLNLQNSKFINNTIGSSDLIYMNGPFGPPTIPNKKDLRNIVEIGTKININPDIYLEHSFLNGGNGLGVYLKKDRIIVFKARLSKFGEVFANKRLYFYVNGKLVGSAVTNKNGVATFKYKRSNLNFTIQVVFNKLTEKTSSKTINYNSASLKGSVSKYIVGTSKIRGKLISVKKKGKLIYRKYYVFNKGNSSGSRNFYKKISSKYKLVKYRYKGITFKYNKSKKSFTAKAKNLLPYKFNKKSMGVLILVLKRR